MSSVEKKEDADSSVPAKAADQQHTSSINELSSEEESSQEDSSSGAVVVISSSAALRTGKISRNSKPSFLANFDSFLQHYVAFTATAAHQEQSLKLLQWTLWMAGYVKKSTGLRKLYSDVSWARYVLRVLGFPASLEAARSGSWGTGKTVVAASSDDDDTCSRQWWISRLGSVMAYSMIAYYPSEHIAYLGWMAPSVLPHATASSRSTKLLRNANLVSAYSCRFWLVYLIAEMTQSTFKLKALFEEKRVLLKDKEEEEGTTGGDEQESSTKAFSSSSSLATLQDAIRNQQLQLVRSVLFTLPCIHWSLPRWDTDPWLKESVVNGLMWVESIVSMYQSITNYQKSESSSTI